MKENKNNNIGIYSCSFDIFYFDKKFIPYILDKVNIQSFYKEKIKTLNIKFGLLLLNNETKKIASKEETIYTIKSILNKHKIKTDNIHVQLRNIKVLNYHGNINYKLN